MMNDVDISNADVMELRDLRSLVAVARTGSFTRAAGDLGYTQSAVSQHIASLEKAVGRPLLLRRPVRLTEVGARLVEHAAHVVMRLDVALGELAVTDDAPAEIRLALTPLADSRRVARALRFLRSGSPRIQLRLATNSATAAVAAVASGEIDLAVVDGITAPGSPLALADAGLLRSFVVGEEELAVVVPGTHPLRGDTVDLEVLVDAHWITAPALMGRLPTLLHRTGPSTFSLDGMDVLMLLELVAAGHGLALLPRRVGTLVDGVRTLRLRHPTLVNRTEVLMLHNAVDRHQAVIDALRGSPVG
jgi:DNA-binding transcriptional LysR family regulator